jgi:hypothetical protein
MNVAKAVVSAKRVKDDPFGFLVDKLLAIIANLLIPFPLAGELVMQFKHPLMGMLMSLVVFALLMVTVVGTIVMSPLLVGSGVLKSISSAFENPTNIAIDESFSDTAVPKKCPFGGNGMAYASITAYFLDPGYYLQFGRNHTGVDMVPAQEYYSGSKTYQDTHQVVVFATISGSVSHYVDQYGGEIVEITNTDNSFRILYDHFSRVLVDNGATIRAGTPVGIMGDTGFSTGDHVHYEVKIKDGDTWRAVNPLNYIQ